LYFQQDGATCYTSRETIILLHEKFAGRVISRNGDFNSPPRSCDLARLKFFLRGYVKNKVYSNAPATTEALKDNIKVVIREIEPDFCENVMKNYLKRMAVCKKSLYGNFDDIIFHD
ncbi:hypothetical protein WN55_04237, partial [Dufourea novaeangliae]